MQQTITCDIKYNDNQVVDNQPNPARFVTLYELLIFCGMESEDADFFCQDTNWNMWQLYLVLTTYRLGWNYSESDLIPIMVKMDFDDCAVIYIQQMGEDLYKITPIK